MGTLFKIACLGVFAAAMVVSTADGRERFSASMHDAAVQFALQQRYLSEDIPALTDAIETMAKTPKPASLSRCSAPLKLIRGGRQSAAALLVNPVCGECARVIDLVKTFAEKSPATAPTIYIGEVAAPDEASTEAVLLLHNLASDPDARLALLQELLGREPSTAQAVRSIARAYAPALVERRERGELHNEPPCDPTISTPIIIYRDRVLQKTRSGRIAFDPLRNRETLRLALAAVDDLQTTDIPQPGGSRGVCRNTLLARAFRIMDRACTPEFCSGQVLRELDNIARPDLLQALRDPELMSVHLFFAGGRAAVTQALDWNDIKRDQLNTVSHLDDPSGTIIFIVGYASGNSADDVPVARIRTTSVSQYLENDLGLRCKSIKRISFGTSILRLHTSDARLLGLAPRDYRDDETILNQAIHVFVYPCADQL